MTASTRVMKLFSFIWEHLKRTNNLKDKPVYQATGYDSNFDTVHIRFNTITVLDLPLQFSRGSRAIGRFGKTRSFHSFRSQFQEQVSALWTLTDLLLAYVWDGRALCLMVGCESVYEIPQLAYFISISAFLINVSDGLSNSLIIHVQFSDEIAMF